jgi:SAM-dependent methyltransferase
MDPMDVLELEPERQTIFRYEATLGQHEARWWEYAMAHRAIATWYESVGEYLEGRSPQVIAGTGGPLLLADVGGAGSRFAQSLVALTSEDILTIDPEPRAADLSRVVPYVGTVEQFAAQMSHNQFDCLTAISVIEHLENVIPFLRACHMLLKPGGLLFLTTDCWNKEGEDVAHFHWMRKRIYTPESLGRLMKRCRELGFGAGSRCDWTYHGDTVYDYSFASLAMVKR